MNPETLGSTGPLESLTPHLDKICDRFEAALKAAGKSGPRPRIEDYLGDVPAAEWEAILPPPSNHCLRCGLDHDPPDTGRGQPVQIRPSRVITTATSTSSRVPRATQRSFQS